MKKIVFAVFVVVLAWTTGGQAGTQARTQAVAEEKGVASSPMTTTIFLPIIVAPTAPFKGTGGCYLDIVQVPQLIAQEVEMGVSWCYNWDGEWLSQPPVGLSYEVVNMIKFTTTPLTMTAREGEWVLLLNEPDLEGTSPKEAAEWVSHAAQRMPTARLICCGVSSEAGALLWMDEFVRHGGADLLAGYAFHTYSSQQGGNDCFDDPCLLNNWQRIVDAHVAWAKAKMPTREIWLTETSWHPQPSEDWDTNVRRMLQICGEIRRRPDISRFAWYYGQHPWSPEINGSSLFRPAANGLSPTGQAFSRC